MKIILDIGSCHCGKLSYAKEAIDLVAEVGASSIKFQLFKGNNHGNIELPREWWPELVDYAKGKIDIFASCFDEEAIQLLYDTGIRKIKLAYSQNFNLKLIRKARNLGMEIIASGDLNNYPGYADKIFYCIPEYPIKNWGLDMDGFYHWDGFSSHWLGIKSDIRLLRNTPAIENREFFLEKHFTLDYEDIDVPDNWFALTPKELKEMMKCL